MRSPGQPTFAGQDESLRARYLSVAPEFEFDLSEDPETLLDARLENLHFFNLRNVLTRLLVEFRAMFFGANFDFLALILEGNWASFLL